MTASSSGYENRIRRMKERLFSDGIRGAVLEAAAKTPRHLFVEEIFRSRAYDEIVLPIGCGEYMLPPYAAVKMIELLCGHRPQPPAKVLEIGIGSGYQAALLQACGVADIYAVERHHSLCEQAKSNLRAAGMMAKVRMVCGDGMQGLPEAALFDGILVGMPCRRVPADLLGQLAVGGRLAALVEENQDLYLWLADKTPQGIAEVCVQKLAPFVTLQGRLLRDCEHFNTP